MLHAKFKKRHRIPLSLAAAIIASASLCAEPDDNSADKTCVDASASCVADDAGDGSPNQ